MLNYLLIAEYIVVFGAILGAVVAVLLAKPIYALIPISISMLLNLINRLRLERQTRERTNTALNRMYQQILANIQSLEAQIFSVNQKRTLFNNFSPQSSEMMQVQQAIASLQEHLQNRLAQLESPNLEPMYRQIKELSLQKDLLQSLQKQFFSLEEFINNIIDYLNKYSLKKRVESLEELISLLSTKITSIESQFISLSSTTQGNIDSSSEQSIVMLSKKLKYLEEAIAPLLLNIQSLETSLKPLSPKIVSLEETITLLFAEINNIKHQIININTQINRENNILEQEHPNQSLINIVETIPLKSQGDKPQQSTNFNTPVQEKQKVTNRKSKVKNQKPEIAFISPKWKCIDTFKGHSDWVRSLAISPDGNILASGSFDQRIKLWDLHNRQLINTLSAHTSGIFCLDFSTDGKTLVSGSFDQTIKIWNLDTFELIYNLIDHSGSVQCVAISPNNQTLISGSFDETMKLWQLNTGELIDTLTEAAGPIYAIAFSADGRTLASGGSDGLITIWHLSNSGQNWWLPIDTFTGNSNLVWSLAISPDGQIIACGNGDGLITLWKINTGEKVGILEGHLAAVMSVVISPDGQTLISASADGTIKLWHLPTGKYLDSLKDDLAMAVISVAMSPDGKTLVSGSVDGTIRIWCLEIS